MCEAGDPVWKPEREALVAATGRGAGAASVGKDPLSVRGRGIAALGLAAGGSLRS